MPNENKQTGLWGEDIAVAYLRDKGYEILQRNFTRRVGEIDIIARDGKTVVFVEVKLRKGTYYGSPAEYVNAAKRRRLLLTAELWLQAHPREFRSRFDVIEILAPQGQATQRLKINHIEDAYES